MNHKQLCDYLNRWIRLQQEGIGVSDLIRKRDISRVAIYGFCDVTRTLIYELKESEIDIVCVIDRNAMKIDWYSFDFCTVEQINQKDVDAIIIMPVDDYQIIIESLQHIKDVELITFEELIYEL